MPLRTLKPFIPSGPDFALAKGLFSRPGLGQREVHLIDPAGVCWHFA